MEKFYNIEEQRFWNDESNWVRGGHEWSDHFGSTEKLWNEYIFDDVKPFRDKKILEIAPGYGRMTQFLSLMASELQVIDMNQTCLDKTKEKLKHHVSKYHLNDGKSLTNCPDGYFDLVFSFDSFVHMHANVIEEYVKEINRVLKPGGTAYIHHSWFTGGMEFSFRNVAGRSNMSPELMKSFVEDNNMQVVNQKSIQFSKTVDAITIFSKPEII